MVIQKGLFIYLFRHKQLPRSEMTFLEEWMWKKLFKHDPVALLLWRRSIVIHSINDLEVSERGNRSNKNIEVKLPLLTWTPQALCDVIGSCPRSLNEIMATTPTFNSLPGSPTSNIEHPLVPSLLSRLLSGTPRVNIVFPPLNNMALSGRHNSPEAASQAERPMHYSCSFTQPLSWVHHTRLFSKELLWDASMIKPRPWEEWAKQTRKYLYEEAVTQNWT